MSAKDRKARSLIARMSPEDRDALRRQAAGTIKVGTGKELPQAFIACGLFHEADKDRRKADKAEARSNSTALHMLSAECPKVSALWSTLGELLACPLAWRQAMISLPVMVRALLARRQASDWISSPVISHCFAWVVRPVPRPRLVPRHASKVREYPLGFASARSGWRYRAGAERTAVQGYTGKVQPVIRHAFTVPFVPAAVWQAAAAADLSPMAAVKWSQVDRGSLALLEVSEPVDFSLQAAGINTGKGYSRQRHGKAYDPRDMRQRIAAMARKAGASFEERQAAAKQFRKAAEAARQAAEDRRQADILRNAAASRGRLVSE